MSLRRRVLLVLTLALATLLATIYLLARGIWLASLDQLEIERTQVDLHRVREAIADDLDRMSATGGDWAKWDDTYRFIEDANAAFVEANLRDSTLPTLRIDAMAFVRRDGTLVASLARDEADRTSELPDSVRTALRPDGRMVSAESPVRGLAALDDGIWLVVSQPILTSDETGPARGVVVLFDRVDAAAMQHLSARTRLDATLHSSAPSGLPTEIEREVEAMLAEREVDRVVARDEGRITGYVLLPCMACDTPIVARIESARDLHAEGVRATAYLLGTIVSAGSVLGLLALLVLERTVLARVQRIGRAVRSIGEGRGAPRRVPPDGADELGRLVGDVNSMLDSIERAESERRASEAALRESEAKFRRVVENISDGILIDDVAGRIVFANKRFADIFGIAAESLPAAWPGGYVAPADAARLLELRRRRIAGEDAPSRVEFEGRHRDGTSRWIDMQVVVLRDAGGCIVGTQSALRDVTERRTADVALRQAELRMLELQKMEAVGRLAGGVAHDFNNVLMVIHGYGEILAADPRLQGPARVAVGSILEAADRAAGLTRQLLTFSRKQVVRPTILDLNAVVEDAARMLRPLVGEDVELVLELDAGLGRVMADAGQLHQVIMNLVVNARDAMPRGGRVTISTTNCLAAAPAGDSAGPVGPTRRVRLSVTDTGCGMAPDVVSRIFEPFFTTKPVGKGTGLGLAIVYGVVTQCGGTIEVVSAPGAGTTFRIEFARIDAAAPATVPESGPASAAKRGTGGTILVAEDEPEVLGIVRTVLSAAGYRVLEAPTPDAAIATAKAHAGRIDVLLSDVVMPKMSGPEVADLVRAAHPGIAVVFMSGYVGDELDRRLVDTADIAFLHKPFRAAELLDAVRAAMPRDDSAAPPWRGAPV